MPKIETLVDEGFRVSLIETAFFDGNFEIPHIDAPKDIVVPSGLVPFSQKAAQPDSIFHALETKTEFVQYSDWTTRMKQK